MYISIVKKKKCNRHLVATITVRKGFSPYFFCITDYSRSIVNIIDSR